MKEWRGERKEGRSGERGCRGPALGQTTHDDDEVMWMNEGCSARRQVRGDGTFDRAVDRWLGLMRWAQVVGQSPSRADNEHEQLAQGCTCQYALWSANWHAVQGGSSAHTKDSNLLASTRIRSRELLYDWPNIIPFGHRSTQSCINPVIIFCSSNPL